MLTVNFLLQLRYHLHCFIPFHVFDSTLERQRASLTFRDVTIASLFLVQARSSRRYFNSIL
jgi:hypothetical protein